VRPFVINGDVWGVVRVPAGDPSLVDRTGTPRLATTDPATRTIFVLDSVMPPLLDRVMLHEVAHAITVSWRLLGRVRSAVPASAWVPVEEWAAQLVEGHAIEAVAAASRSLGRPVCVEGACMGKPINTT
jgi:hypothetical protein